LDDCVSFVLQQIGTSLLDMGAVQNSWADGTERRVAHPRHALLGGGGPQVGGHDDRQAGYP
jgi:hypothetical protein